MSELMDEPGSMGGSSTFSFTATLDYYVMPDTYYNTLIKGLAHDVPVITGNAKVENGATFGINLTMSEYLSSLNKTFGEDWAPEFFYAFPANSSVDAGKAYNSQWTQRSTVGTWNWANLWATARTSPVFTYIWDHAPPGQNQDANHELEIDYVMNNLYGTDLPWTEEDYLIVQKMNQDWVNFIKTGNPNIWSEGDQKAVDLAPWPETSNEPVVQHVGNGWGPVPVSTEERVSLFERWFSTLKTY